MTVHDTDARLSSLGERSSLLVFGDALDYQTAIAISRRQLPVGPLGDMVTPRKVVIARSAPELPVKVDDYLRLAAEGGSASYAIGQSLRGSLPIGLVVAGRRTYTRESSSSNRLVQRFEAGPRDCYAVWYVHEDKVLPLADIAGVKQVYTACATTGVTYAEEPLYNSRGQLVALRTVVMVLRFDTNGSAFDVNVTRYTHGDKADQGGTIVSSLMPGQFEGALLPRLVMRARRGFQEHCRRAPYDVSEWAAMFTAQRNKAEASLPDVCPIYGCKGEEGWSCLDLVEEAWQLLGVLNAHRGHRSYAAAGTLAARALAMLRSYFALRGSQPELEQMMRDFVVPSGLLGRG